MSKHTPGPWISRYTAIQDGQGGSREFSIVHYRNELPYKETKDEYICRNVSREANARLIAAAPDLLLALKALLEMITDNRLHGDEVYKAANAIAKAEGN